MTISRPSDPYTNSKTAAAAQPDKPLSGRERLAQGWQEIYQTEDRGVQSQAILRRKLHQVAGFGISGHHAPPQA
jgi:hypothetical protein